MHELQQCFLAVLHHARKFTDTRTPVNQSPPVRNVRVS